MTFEEKMKETENKYKKQHTAWIRLKFENTYVGFDTKDSITESYMERIKALLMLMGEEYIQNCPFDNNESYYVIINGENKARAEFIQDFIDNSYRLNWKRIKINDVDIVMKQLNNEEIKFNTSLIDEDVLREMCGLKPKEQDY